MALILLSFIVRPVFVEQQYADGHVEKTVAWQLPMAEMLAQIGGLEQWIDRSWAPMDARFGYTGGMRVNVGKFMRESLQNGLVLMTAGMVNSEGRVETNFSKNIQNFDRASKGMVTAYYNAAQEGMAR